MAAAAFASSVASNACRRSFQGVGQPAGFFGLSLRNLLPQLGCGALEMVVKAQQHFAQEFGLVIGRPQGGWKIEGSKLLRHIAGR